MSTSLPSDSGAAWPDEAITQVDVGEHFDLEDRKDKHWVWKDL